jgi:hypothetical protein
MSNPSASTKPKKRLINCCPHALTKPPQKNYPSNPLTSTKSKQKGNTISKLLPLCTNRTIEPTKSKNISKLLPPPINKITKMFRVS